MGHGQSCAWLRALAIQTDSCNTGRERDLSLLRASVERLALESDVRGRMPGSLFSGRA